MATDQALRDLILAGNPAGYWPLDNPAALGTDLSPFANHGSQSGTFSQQLKTLFGMDMTMTKGGANALVTIPDRAEYRGNRLTIEMVVANVIDANQVLFERGGLNRNWSVQNIATAQAANVQPAISAFLGTPQTPAIFQGGANNLPAVAHIVLLLDGTKLQAVTNGSFSPVTLTTGSGSQPDQGAIPLHLFSRAGSAGVDCFMAHVAIYNRLLTGDEILARNTLLLGQMQFKTMSQKAIPANQEPRSQFLPQDVAWRGIPKLYAGPVSSQKITTFPVVAGVDSHWLRDGVRNVEQGYIESTVTISGIGVRRRVLCLDQAGNLVGETWSRASDGKYRFDLLWLNRRYMLIAQDDPAFGPADYNAVAADYQLPIAYAPGEGVGLTGA